MKLTEIEFTEAKPVEGYGPGFFRIGGVVYDGAVLVLPTGISSWGGFDDTKGLICAASALDVLFVGSGAEIAPVPAAFRTAIEAAGPGVEVMASPTACRTYNVLLSEGRRVGLALFPV